MRWPGGCVKGLSKAHARGTDTQWRKLREACFRVWGKTCMYCGDRATEVDHIIEVARGGTNTIDNLQPLCKPCHLAKTVAFNTVRDRGSQSHVGVFSKRLPPTDSLAGISPRMARFDPPTTERPKS
jgi:5-methylcytosine-specific restriction protein A